MASIPIRPPWLRDDAPAAPSPEKKPASPAAWYPGMPSPNPSGRPKGIIDSRQRLRLALADSADDILQTVINAAKAGDLEACSLILSRVCPPLKPQDERIKFIFDSTAPLATQIEHVLQAIAEGDVPTGMGKTIIEVLGSLAQVRQLDALLARVAELEKLLSEKK